MNNMNTNATPHRDKIREGKVDEAATAFPLSWPMGTPRTPAGRRRRNTLWNGSTVSTATQQIEIEVQRMGGEGLVLSTNLALRVDGFPRSGQPEPADPGAAAFFRRNGKSIVVACDRWATVRWNLRAIGMHLAALRGTERWGCGTLDQAFAGYAALPENATSPNWWSVLGCTQPPATRDEILKAYREAARVSHPDAGGNAAAFDAVAKAYQAGLRAMAEGGQ